MGWTPNRELLQAVLTDLTNPDRTEASTRLATIRAAAEFLAMIHRYFESESEAEANPKVQLSMMACSGLCQAAETAARGTIQLINKGTLS